MNSYLIQKNNNKERYEEFLDKAVIEFEQYFNKKLDKKPCLFFLKSRQEFNDICGGETNSWVTGYSIHNLIFLMEESVYEKESSKKLNLDNYILTIKHEVLHYFFNQIAWKNKPVWLSEGVSLFLSGQTKFRPRPEKFTNFLLFTETNNIENQTVYSESGFVVELLVNKYGKEKLIKLMTSIRHISGNEDFLKRFKEVYNFELNYNEFNKLYLEK